MSQLRCDHSCFICLCLLAIRITFKFLENSPEGGFAVEQPDAHSSISHARLENPPFLWVVQLITEIPQFIAPHLIKFVSIRYFQVPSPWNGFLEQRLVMFRQIRVNTSRQEMLPNQGLPEGVG